MHVRWVQKFALFAVIALGASLMVMTPVASATVVSGVTATPNPLTAGSLATYTLGFTTSASGSLSTTSTITLSGPAGTVFPLTPADYMVNGTPVSTTPTQVGTTNVTITSPVVVSNSTPVVVVAGVGNTATNPTLAGTYSIAVFTSSDQTQLASSPTYSIVAGPVSATTTTILASPTTLLANGSSQSTITVQAKDANGNNLTGTGGVVTLATTVGSIGSVTDHANGTYTATFTSPTTTGTATITGIIGGNPITTTSPTIALTPGPVSAAKTTILASPTTLLANGSSQSTITVQAKDTNGNNLTSSGGLVTLATTVGSIGAVTDNSNGTYTATFTSPTATGTATITGIIGGNAITTTSPTIALIPGPVSAAKTTILASPTTLLANGSSQSTITVQAKDANGNNLTGTGGVVTLATTLGSIGTVVNNSNGTYTAMLTSPTTTGTATITGIIGGSAITTTSPTVTMTGSGSLPTAPTAPTAPAGATSSASATSSTTGGTATAINGGTTASGAGVGALTLAQYGSDPVAAPTFTSTGEYFDVELSPGNSFSAVTVTDCNLNGGNGLEWFNPAGNSGVGTWQVVTPAPAVTVGPPPCESVTLNSSSSPTLAQLDGTVFAVSSATPAPTPFPTPTPTPTAATGYLMVASDGGIFSFGDAAYFGSEGGTHLNKPIVGMALTPDGHGYWLVASDGGIFSFGDAAFSGSEGGTHLNQPIVGMAPTPDGHGYWLVASDGGIFSFGDAAYFGSEGGTHLNQPIVGMAPTPDGHGYWLVASDGGIFSFGDAAYFGSEGGTHLNQPIVGMAPTPDGHGYWLVASDGGIFSFGDAAFSGSEGGTHLNQPIVGIEATPDGLGYWLVASDGGIFSFGDAAFSGSEGGTHLNQPIVGVG